jgi:transcriptional regulator with XRE-family HTH domain
MTSTTPAVPAPRRQRRQRIRYLDSAALARHRAGQGLSQAELAAKAGHGINQSMVSAWEIGRRGASIKNLAALAGALGITPEDLMPADLRAAITDSGGNENGAAA